MNLAVVNDAVTGMNGVEHAFTEEEKNFVVQFAFRSGDKEDTLALIKELAQSDDEEKSEDALSKALREEAERMQNESD